LENEEGYLGIKILIFERSMVMVKNTWMELLLLAKGEIKKSFQSQKSINKSKKEGEMIYLIWIVISTNKNYLN